MTLPQSDTTLNNVSTLANLSVIVFDNLSVLRKKSYGTFSVYGFSFSFSEREK